MDSAPVPVSNYLCGSKPGVFDPTQPARLLRYPDSTLLFASFSPVTFPGTYLPTDVHSRSRRIVVEVPRANDFFSERTNWFSFVPNAVLAPGVVSEGKWPRVVTYCGRRVVCDQDQWDIHKLDPAYDCFVPTSGMHPIITRKLRVQFPGDGTQFPEDDQPTRVCAVPVRETTSATVSILTVSASSGRFAAASSSTVESSTITRLKTPVPARENVVNAARNTDAASGVLFTCSFSTPPAQNAPIPVPCPASSAAPSSSVVPSDQTRPNSPEVDDGGDDDAASTCLPTGSPAYLGKRKTFHHTGTDAPDLSTFSSDGWRASKRPREVSPATLKAEFQRKKAQHQRDRERQVEGLDELTRRKRNNQFWVAETSANVVEDRAVSNHDVHGVLPGGNSTQSVPERPVQPTLESAASRPDPALASGLSDQSTPQSTPGPEANAIPNDDGGALRRVLVAEEKGRKLAQAEGQARCAHQGTREQSTAQDVAAAESRHCPAATDTQARAQAVPPPP